MAKEKAVLQQDLKSVNGQPVCTQWLTQENFFRLVIAAIILRIVIMPFFAHVDVLSEARRIYFWHEAGIYFDDISRNATSQFQLLFFKFFSIFIENKEMMFSHENMLNSTAEPIEYFEFVSNPEVFRTLFIIKLPFLAADLITAWALYQYCGQTTGARRATLFWLFNPMTIFAFYIFGRFESIPIMFCMLSLLAIHRKHIIWAAIAIGMSINSREVFIFLGPVFIALMCAYGAREHSLRSRLIASAIVLFAVAVAVQLVSVTGSSVDAFGRDVTSIATEGRVDYLFKFIVGFFLMFPMVYFAILLYTWNSKVTLGTQSLLVFSLVIISFFVLSSHTAHYTSWLVIFPCIYYSRNPFMLKPLLLLCVTWVFYNLSVTDLGVFTTFLAAPWSMHMVGLPNFPEMYYSLGLSQKMDLQTFQRIWSTFYRTCILYLAIQIILMSLAEIREESA